MTLQFSMVMTEQTLAAVPLFVFMGIMMEQAGLMERLFSAFQMMLAKVKGSLYYAVLFVSVIFAAATGIVGASVTILTLLAVSSNFPFEMEKNQDKERPLLNKRYRPIRSSDNSPVKRNFTPHTTNRLTEEASRAANNLNTAPANRVEYSDIDNNIFPANNTEVPM